MSLKPEKTEAARHVLLHERFLLGKDEALRASVREVDSASSLQLWLAKAAQQIGQAEGGALRAEQFLQLVQACLDGGGAAPEALRHFRQRSAVCINSLSSRPKRRHDYECKSHPRTRASDPIGFAALS